mgnify:CR=1 FL=1
MNNFFYIEILIYKEVFFFCFNECKRNTEISHLSNANFKQQRLWNNEIFNIKKNHSGSKIGCKKSV